MSPVGKHQSLKKVSPFPAPIQSESGTLLIAERRLPDAVIIQFHRDIFSLLISFMFEDL